MGGRLGTQVPNSYLPPCINWVRLYVTDCVWWGEAQCSEMYQVVTPQRFRLRWGSGSMLSMLLLPYYRTQSTRRVQGRVTYLQPTSYVPFLTVCQRSILTYDPARIPTSISATTVFEAEQASIVS